MPCTRVLEILRLAFDRDGIKWDTDIPLSDHTSFRIGGSASLVAWPESKDELILVLDIWRELGEGCPLCILGNGSNVLMSDRGFGGLVVITTHNRRVIFEQDVVEDPETFARTELYCRVYAECGASLTGLSLKAGERGLSGLEFAYGIPGTVGGAVVMNAGAFFGDMERVTLGSDYYDLSTGEVVSLRDEEMDFSYRHSIYQEHPNWVVLSATLTLSYGNPEDIRAQMDKNMTARKTNQPLEYPNAGSVFKRPENNFAGRMVENVGLKGFSVGGAQVSEKHAGFIVNRGEATAAEVIELVRAVRAAVEETYRYRLECEICLITDGLDPNEDSNW